MLCDVTPEIYKKVVAVTLVSFYASRTACEAWNHFYS